ncbi:MAG: efflux RND transporter periplasmic adaptor subunit [Patescibacteria group bacterium]
MRILLSGKSYYVVGAVILIAVALVMLFSLSSRKGEEIVTTTVDQGEVLQLVSVSGVVEAENTAELAFPVTGIAREINVREGDFVQEGEVMATIEQSTLLADRKDALAALGSARADRDELISGPRDEQRAVTNQNILIRENELEQTITEEEQKVANARRTFLSSNLQARSLDPEETATAPTVSGSYNCDQAGEYILDAFSSDAESGFSFRLSGLGGGTYPATTDQASLFGSCGLKLQFTSGDRYSNSDWIIEIPNTKSPNYIATLNALELAEDQATNNIRDAEEALSLALQEQTLENADPRSEALARANAAVAQAEARLERVNAEIEDRTLRAPFAGTVTNVDILAGETVSTNPVITLLADDVFEMTARIPEIDITKVSVDQPAEIVFDARTEEVLPAHISFISPLATEIDGVAYYEAKLQFDEPPSWLRSGLNADIDIIVEERVNVTRLPKRFVIEDNGVYSVMVMQGETKASTTVEVGVVGNDGYIEVIGLNVGDIIVAP